MVWWSSYQAVNEDTNGKGDNAKFSKELFLINIIVVLDKTPV